MLGCETIHATHHALFSKALILVASVHLLGSHYSFLTSLVLLEQGDV